MKKPVLLHRIIIFIAIVTILSGLFQMFFAPLVLDLVGASADATSAHFFSIVGMFMFLFGGLLWQGASKKQRNPVFWASLQKFGASIAVAVGVYHSIFSNIALGVALFDLFSGILILALWNSLSVK
jgi:hypothetical protein